MHRIDTIRSLRRHDLGDDLFARLIEVAPKSRAREGVTPRLERLAVIVNHDDPALETVVEMLVTAGWTQVQDPHPTRSAKKRFRVSTETILDEDDWAATEYVVVAGGSVDRFGGAGRIAYSRNGGEVMLPVTSLRAKEDASFAGPNNFDHLILVPDHVRKMIESEFPEASFFDVGVFDPRTIDDEHPVLLEWSPAHERWWHLYSSVTMPWPGPGCRLRPYNRTDPSPPPPGSEFPTVFAPDDDGLAIPHYRRSDIEAMGPFDLAITAEKFSHYARSHRLVASQRFWQWSLDRGIDFEKQLVRIDED